MGVLTFTTPVPNLLPDCWNDSVTVGQGVLTVILDALGKPHAFGEKGATVNTWQAPPQSTMVLVGLEYSVRAQHCLQC